MVWDGPPFSLAPVTGLPRLRNLYAKSCLPLRTTTGLLSDSIKAAAMATPKPASRDQLVISSR